jgi:ATPase subunit of ABC transporter with duplicated ATPase domains
MRERLQSELDRNGLPHLRPDTPAASLSGGEAMRVSLIAAWLSSAAFLILDEPSNHLDRANRLALQAQLQRWPHGLLVISHDRELLEQMERIVELSPLGLRSYGGGYSFYAACKHVERESAQRQLDQRKLERKRETAAMREQHERQERRMAKAPAMAAMPIRPKSCWAGRRTARKARRVNCGSSMRRSRSSYRSGCARLRSRWRRWPPSPCMRWQARSRHVHAPPNCKTWCCRTRRRPRAPSA